MSESTTPTGSVPRGAVTPSVYATLRAQDAPALIDYLVSTFGFVVRARYDGENGAVEHAQLAWPEGTGAVMLGSARDDSTWSLKPGTAGTYVVTADPTALYGRVSAALGAGTIVQELEQPDYGGTTFTVRDPEGNLWSFGDYVGEPG